MDKIDNLNNIENELNCLLQDIGNAVLTFKRKTQKLYSIKIKNNYTSVVIKRTLFEVLWNLAEKIDESINIQNNIILKSKIRELIERFQSDDIDDFCCTLHTEQGD